MPKLIQLMPAKRWVAICRDEVTDDDFHVPLVAWGLDDEGYVIPLYADKRGKDYGVHDARERTDFRAIGMRDR